MKTKRFKTLLIVATAMVLIIGVPCIVVCREVRHQRLNRELILAIEAENEDRALSLLRQGADGTARENDATKHTSAGDELREFWNRLRHKQDPALKPGDAAMNRGALLLYYNSTPPEGAVNTLTVPGHPQERLALALIDAHAEISDTDDSGATPLYWAVHYHHHTVVRRLVSAGAAVNVELREAGGSPLIEADAEDTRVLLGHGADLNTDREGEGPLFEANAEKTELLLLHGAHIEDLEGYGWTPLYFACFNGDDLTVRVLLAHHANVSAQDTLYGLTPLLRAARSCRLETIKALVNAGANIHTRGWNGTTALMFSVDNGDNRVFYWLLNQGIDVNLRGIRGETALTVAQQRRAEAISQRRTEGAAEVRLSPEQGSARRAAEVARFDAMIRELRNRGARQVKPTGDWFYPDDPSVIHHQNSPSFRHFAPLCSSFRGAAVMECFV